MAWALVSSGGSNVSVPATGSSYTYTLPGGAPGAGVLEVLWLVTGGAFGSVSAGGGAAWTSLQVYSDYSEIHLLYRITNGSEGTTVLFAQTYTSALNWSVQFMRWSGQAVSTPLDTSAISGNSHAGGSTTPALSTGTLAGTGELVLAFGGLANFGNSAPTSPVWTGATVTDSGNGPAWAWDATNTRDLPATRLPPAMRGQRRSPRRWG